MAPLAALPLDRAVLCLRLAPGDDADALWDWARRRTSDDERTHAARLRHAGDALAHLAGRAGLRAALAALGVPPPATFPPGPWGKPTLPGLGLEASISHAGAEVWLALSRAAPVGIDTERFAGAADPVEILPALHPLERTAIAALEDDAARRAALWRLWCRKEAVAKACGRGVGGLDLADYAVATGPEPAGWLRQPPPDTPAGALPSKMMGARRAPDGGLATILGRLRPGAGISLSGWA